MGAATYQMKAFRVTTLPRSRFLANGKQQPAALGTELLKTIEPEHQWSPQPCDWCPELPVPQEAQCSERP